MREPNLALAAHCQHKRGVYRLYILVQRHVGARRELLQGYAVYRPSPPSLRRTPRASKHANGAIVTAAQPCSE